MKPSKKDLKKGHSFIDNRKLDYWKDKYLLVLEELVKLKEQQVKKNSEKKKDRG